MDRIPIKKLVEMVLKKLAIEDGVLSLRYELRGTNCEAHISLIYNRDTVNVIKKWVKMI